MTSVRRHALAKCEDCSLNVPSSKYVPSAGPKDADIAVVGEAPGYLEANKGLPFVGPSGKLLGEVLAHHGINKHDVFLTNVVLCKPPENRTPTKKEIECCAQRLRTELTNTDPGIIYGVGGTASSAIHGSPVKITAFRAGPVKQAALYPRARFVPTFHPANCLRTADNFPHLVKDIGKPFTTQVRFSPPEYVVVDDPHKAVRALDEIRTKTDRIVIDIETAFDKDVSFEHPNHYSLLCIGIGYAKQKVLVLGRTALASQAVCNSLGSLLSTKRIIAHNGKFDLKALLKIAPKAQLWFDTMLAHYALDERGGIHGLKYLAKEFLGAPDWDKDIKAYKVWADIPPDLLHRYNAYDVACTWLLYERFERELSDQNLSGLHSFLVRASNVLMHMEMAGLQVDSDRLAVVALQMEASLEKREEVIQAWVKNPRSPKQVKEALELSNIQTESTDVEHLTAILEAPGTTPDMRVFVTLLLEYRKEQKLYGTYVKGTKARLYDDRVYPNFLLHGTTTGRLSCRNPNLQNVPRGSVIKSLFVPGHNKIFIQADYSQLEYRVVTTLAQEPYLKDIFDDPTRDVFWELARSTFGPQATKHHRQMTKRIVHSSNYGAGPETLAELINGDALNFGVPDRITVAKAKILQDLYFSTIPKVKAWRDTVAKTLFTDHDDLVTYYGRHRRFWLITKENKHSVEKEGLAFVPQSTGSDICLSALITLYTKHGIDARVPVHDSIMAVADQADEEDVKRIMSKVMTEAAQEYTAYVPFTVDIQSSTDSWGALE